MSENIAEGRRFGDTKIIFASITGNEIHPFLHWESFRKAKDEYGAAIWTSKQSSRDLSAVISKVEGRQPDLVSYIDQMTVSGTLYKDPFSGL